MGSAGLRRRPELGDGQCAAFDTGVEIVTLGLGRSRGLSPRELGMFESGLRREWGQGRKRHESPCRRGPSGEGERDTVHGLWGATVRQLGWG